MGSCVSFNTIVEEEFHEPESRGRRRQRQISPFEAPGDDRGRSCSKCSVTSSEVTSVREDFSVRVIKQPGDFLGAGLGKADKGAIIFNIKENGLLDAWNKANPSQTLYSGLIVTEVNGVTGYWSILEELRRPGEHSMTISATPPRNASSNWFEEIAEMGRNLEIQGGAFMVKLQPQEPGAKGQPFSTLPNVRAGDVGVEQCAICIEEIGADETVLQLPCKHAFHPICAARWLTQGGKHAQGKRQCCPLCCRKVVRNANGGISTVDADAEDSQR